MSTARWQWWGAMGLALGLVVARPAWALEEAAVDNALRVAREQLARTAETLSPGAYPKSSRPDGTWKTVPAADKVGWVQGFYPGSLWLTYELTGDPVWRTRAEEWTRPLEVQRFNTTTHDLGFKLMLSYGHAYRLEGDAEARQVLLDAAASLATRYDEKVRGLNCCDWNPAWHLPLVIDTMVNIELLFWGAENGGKPEWRDMALNHALKTLEDLVREDGGTFHYVDYEPRTGAKLSSGTFQGHADASTWVRGQVWAMYGYTLAYRFTKDARMLEAARKVTDYYLDRLPEDHVPNWDFDAPRQVKDSSAAAAAASALLELQLYETDPERKQRYHAAAVKTLESLTSPAYLNVNREGPGILLHATGHLPANQEIDVSLIYGDYYFLEALYRYKQHPTVELPQATEEKSDGGSCSAAPGVSAAAWGLLVLLALRRRARAGR